MKIGSLFVTVHEGKKVVISNTYAHNFSLFTIALICKVLTGLYILCERLVLSPLKSSLREPLPCYVLIIDNNVLCARIREGLRLFVIVLLLVDSVSVSAQELMSSQSSSNPPERVRQEQLKSDNTTNVTNQRVERHFFQMPEREELLGCSYTTGYSFPDECRDEKGNVIFDLLKDDQSVLDKIIKKQGRQGKYNKIEHGIWIRRKSGHSVPEESIDVTGLSPAEAERKAAFEAHGYDYFPPAPGEKNYVEDTFVMPENEILDHCAYATGYSFPARCFNENGDIIFESAIHNQKVLDKIIKKQHKPGKYNKLPDGGPVKYEGLELPRYKNIRE